MPGIMGGGIMPGGAPMGGNIIGMPMAGLKGKGGMPIGGRGPIGPIPGTLGGRNLLASSRLGWTGSGGILAMLPPCSCSEFM